MFRYQTAITRKAATLQFLNALATGVQTTPTPAFIPTFAPPKTTKPQTKHTSPKEEGSSITTSSKKPKAEILRLYRAKLG